MNALLKQFARRLLGRRTPAAAVTTHPFDLAHGVDTSGLLEGRNLRTGHASDPHNTAYFGVPPSRFRNCIAQWRSTEATLPTEAYRLVDLGCGKGRAVLLASRMGFRDVVGVELHSGLAAASRANLDHWQQSGPTGPAAVLWADAAAALPGLLDGPVLLYLYNPFRAPVLRQVLEAVMQRADTQDGPTDVLYLYPEHEDVFQEFPRMQRLWHRAIPLDAEDEDDGISSATDPCSLYRVMPLSAAKRPEVQPADAASFVTAGNPLS